MIPVYTSAEAEELCERGWETTTPEERLGYYNNMATRPCPPMHYWREILELANYFANKG